MKSRGQSFLQKTIDSLLVVILVTFPFTVNIALTSVADLSHPFISANFSIGDLLIGFVFLIWLAKVILYREKPDGLPLPILIFVMTLVLSGVNTFSVKDWIKELIQFVEYFVVFYLLLLNSELRGSLQKIRNILFSVATVIIGIGCLQLFAEESSPFLIRGVFENRNVFGAYLCIIVLLAFSDFAYSKTLLRSVWLALLVIAGVTVALSISAVIAIGTGMLVVLIVVGRPQRFRAFCVIGLIFLSVVFNVPERDFKEMTGNISWYENGKISENYYRIINILERQEKKILYEKPVSSDQLIVIRTSLFAQNKLPEQVNGSRYIEKDHERHVKNRYLEMHAALNVVSDNLLTGIGLGNFQNQIGTYYEELPKVNTTEPDQHSGFFILATTTGLIGITAFIWILITSIRSAYSCFRYAKKPIEKGEYLGIFAALISASVENFFGYILVTGIIALFILLIFFALKKQLPYDSGTIQ